MLVFMCIPTKRAVETATMAAAQNSGEPRLVEGNASIHTSKFLSYWLRYGLVSVLNSMQEMKE